MQKQYDAFEARNVHVIGIAQEDPDLAAHAKILSRFDPPPRFDLVADLERAGTSRYRRTSTYLVDADGFVRQIFPNVVRHRADWGAILAEIDRRARPAPVLPLPAAPPAAPG